MKKSNINWGVTWILTAIFILYSTGIFLIAFRMHKIEIVEIPRIETIILESEIDLHGLKINQEIQNDIEYYITFYETITKNRMIAKAIINYSLELDIPVNIAFALAFCESSFRPNVENRNRNGSYDFGLFQLNNRTFKDIDYFDIETNTRTGISFLKELYDRTDSYFIALVFYNAGSYRRTIPRSSLFYAEKILTKENEYDMIFNDARKMVKKNE